MLARGAKTNLINKHSGFTPVHWAARHGELEIVKLLCDKGACEYMPDHMGYTPLDYAGRFKHLKVVSYLVKRIKEKAKTAI